MTVWTWQGDGFQITSGMVDHKFSTFNASVPNYHDPIARLSDCIKCARGQFLWCYVTEAEALLRPWHGRSLFRLEVPTDDVLCYYDDLVWHKIIKQGPFSYWRLKGHRVSRYMYSMARHVRIEEHTGLMQFFDELEEWWWRPESDDELWGKLLLGSASSSFAQVLIPFPVESNWVVT